MTAENRELDGLVVISVAQLEAIVRNAVREELTEQREARKVLTQAEAADYLRISESALHKRVARGHITPDIRRGRGSKTNCFTKETLDGYVGASGPRQTR